MQKTINVIALTIAIIGAINWGLIGFFNFNLVSYLFGSASVKQTASKTGEAVTGTGHSLP